LLREHVEQEPRSPALDLPLMVEENSGLGGRVKKLLKHSIGVVLLDQIAVSITNFSTGILIGRFCSKSELGLYMLGYSVLLFAIALQQMAISSPFIALRPRLDGELARNYTSGAYSQQFLFSGACSLALVIASFAVWFKQPQLSAVLLCYAIATPCMLFKEMYRRVCFSTMHARRALAVDVAVGAVQIAVLFAFARTEHMSAVTGVLTVAMATSLLLMGWLLRGKDGIWFGLRDARAVLKDNWTLAQWIIGSQLLWAASLYSYPWLISHLKGTASAGVWAACFGINALGNPLLLGLQNFIEPRISHAWADGGAVQVRRLVWKSTAVLAGSMLAFSGFIFFAGARAIVMLYGPKYGGNGLTVTLITLSFAAGAAGFAFSCGFFVSGKGKLDMRISWVYPIALLACGVPLVARFGPLGGGLSLVIANTVSTLLRAAQFLVTFRDPFLTAAPAAQETAA
jgi:O-antigen/teichoic acid export membrane protein